MIKHVVFFEIVDEAEGKLKPEILQYIKSELESLVPIIPKLKKMEVGINYPKAPVENYDFVLISEFENWEDLNTYLIHPEHQRVATYIGKVKTSRACVDYEV